MITPRMLTTTCPGCQQELAGLVVTVDDLEYVVYPKCCGKRISQLVSERPA